MEEWIQTIALAAVPFLLAITLHEAAHAYAARYFGDPTAAAAGRITLNPLAHIDLFGTILLPLSVLLLSAGSMAFGYAKPVPVNFNLLRNPKRNMLWVAAAGPAANFVMLLGWFALLNIAIGGVFGTYGSWVGEVSRYGILINVVLMVLNLLPLPPLDGGRIVVSLLPDHLAMQFAKLEPFGFFILILLLVTDVLGEIINPIINAVLVAVQSIFHLF